MNSSYYAHATATTRKAPKLHPVYVVGREALFISIPVGEYFPAFGSWVEIRW
jgi:hypothetical protein